MLSETRRAGKSSSIDPDRSPSPTSRISGTEWAVAVSLFVVMGLFRWVSVQSQIWNSDEPQHLHVAWAWANGLLPYRDVFDNHSPLFAWLVSGPFRWLGERADIVEPMRMLMAPFFALSLWFLYRIGASLWSPRVGLWAAVLGGFLPKWFRKMGEVRTDVLWTTLWLGALAVLVGGRRTPMRLFCAGLMLGAAFAVSMKSVLLLATLACAGLLTLLFCRRVQTPVVDADKPWLRSLGAGVLGLLLVPAAWVGFFAAHGMLDKAYYGIIEHNLLGNVTVGPTHLERFARASWSLLPTAIGVWLVLPAVRADPLRAERQLFIVLVSGTFYPLLHTFWEAITPQDYMPIFPVAAVPITALVIAICSRGPLRSAPWLGAVAMALAEIIWLVHQVPPMDRPNRRQIGTIAEALELTRPGEPVMDAKGDLIFRPRSYYYVLESITRRRLMKHLMPDEVPQCLVAGRTAVVSDPSRMMLASQQFVAANYLPAGDLLVAGKWIDMAGDRAPARFEVVIPQSYTLLSEDGSFAGTVDGEPFRGPRELAAGTHVLQRFAGKGRVALYWSRAASRGYSPFPNRSASVGTGPLGAVQSVDDNGARPKADSRSADCERPRG